MNGVRRVGTRLTIIIYPYARRVSHAHLRADVLSSGPLRTYTYVEDRVLLIRSCTYVSAEGQMFVYVRTYVLTLSVYFDFKAIRTYIIYVYI